VSSQTGSPGFPDVPAAYLGNACGFSFADGHAIIHRWQTATLLGAKGSFPPLGSGSQNQDWLWFSQHAAAN